MTKLEDAEKVAEDLLKKNRDLKKYFLSHDSFWLILDHFFKSLGKPLLFFIHFSKNMYIYSLIPKKSLTNPLKNFGTSGGKRGPAEGRGYTGFKGSQFLLVWNTW